MAAAAVIGRALRGVADLEMAAQAIAAEEAAALQANAGGASEAGAADAELGSDDVANGQVFHVAHHWVLTRGVDAHTVQNGIRKLKAVAALNSFFSGVIASWYHRDCQVELGVNDSSISLPRALFILSMGFWVQVVYGLLHQSVNGRLVSRCTSVSVPRLLSRVLYFCMFTTVFSMTWTLFAVLVFPWWNKQAREASYCWPWWVTWLYGPLVFSATLELWLVVLILLAPCILAMCAGCGCVLFSIFAAFTNMNVDEVLGPIVRRTAAAAAASEPRVRAEELRTWEGSGEPEEGLPLECAICFEVLQGRLCGFPCDTRHTFHVTCAQQWLDVSQNCPVCRHPVSRAELNSG
eukprot:TRINITY_DN22865_c0_g1_i1.p1 TRINITY_DN22865_c0_g1~~TRINITY_DN22865_c0_g1_i1.p1  ORF type:complete len:350 (-),score=74.61 TRINITY_DN22865_c0_g1_i1:71-1120(-)